MLFMIGLDRLSREEKIALLAQLNAINSRNVLSEGAQQGLKRGKDLVFQVSQLLLGQFSSDWAEGVKRMKEQLDWDVNTLQAAIEREYRQLDALGEFDLGKNLLVRMAQIAGVDPTSSTSAVSEALIKRAAKACKIPIDQDIEVLEALVFEHCLEEKIAQIQEQLTQMTDSELEELEAVLREEIQSLSQAEQEAIRTTMGLDELSAKHVITFLKQASGIALAQMIISGFGFGAYLFLTTLIKSFSLLLGVTFSFGVYTTATSALAFLLSGPFLLLASLMGFGLMYRKAGHTIYDELAKLLVFGGRSAFLQMNVVQ
ncbi:MAG: hypothetical protein GX030_04915 [Firmicutes bacterium]|nr:hypothetical protein [Bacillota bacterium]